mmetsp:Transcript_4383/g.13043  ORF Transcript_4383/g.13043 Transcript_4383/m.13043 type:complete len:285 (-) Transcript_4383:423-1277(-)
MLCCTAPFCRRMASQASRSCRSWKFSSWSWFVVSTQRTSWARRVTTSCSICPVSPAPTRGGDAVPMLSAPPPMAAGSPGAASVADRVDPCNRASVDGSFLRGMPTGRWTLRLMFWMEADKSMAGCCLWSPRSKKDSPRTDPTIPRALSGAPPGLSSARVPILSRALRRAKNSSTSWLGRGRVLCAAPGRSVLFLGASTEHSSWKPWPRSATPRLCPRTCASPPLLSWSSGIAPAMALRACMGVALDQDGDLAPMDRRSPCAPGGDSGPAGGTAAAPRAARTLAW